MLDNLQLMSGFRQIKDEFRTKFRITKPAHELALWFTYKNGELYVHDMEDHKTAMVIAFLSKDIFTIHLIHSHGGCFSISRV